jgi:gliding motility-associated-like protein
MAADCDQDGETNGFETTKGTNPNDPCSYTNAPATTNAVYATWSLIDCDGDGVTNAQEIIDLTDPTDPCESIEAHVTLPQSAEFLAGDCDGDTLSNGLEIGDDPKNPDDTNNNGIFDYLEVNNGEEAGDIEIFNLVTPNADGENDVFVIRNLDKYTENELQIYNRWGVLVYETVGYGQKQNFFTGVSNGRVTIDQDSQLPEGSYFYVFKYTHNTTGETKSKTGYLYINR